MQVLEEECHTTWQEVRKEGTRATLEAKAASQTQGLVQAQDPSATSAAAAAAQWTLAQMGPLLQLCGCSDLAASALGLVESVSGSGAVDCAAADDGL